MSVQTVFHRLDSTNFSLDKDVANHQLAAIKNRPYQQASLKLLANVKLAQYPQNP